MYELPEEVVDVGMITMYKIHIGGYMDKKGLMRYRPNVDEWDSLR